jgi:ribosomal subunit interface protein
MKLIIKGKQFKIPEDLYEFAKEKMTKFEKRLPENAILELELEDTWGSKEGNDKICQLNLIMPGEKKTIHFCERADGFREAINLIQEKLEREVEEYKEKRKPYF